MMANTVPCASIVRCCNRTKVAKGIHLRRRFLAVSAGQNSEEVTDPAQDSLLSSTEKINNPKPLSMLEHILHNQRRKRFLPQQPSVESVIKTTSTQLPQESLFDVFQVPDPPPVLRQSPTSFPEAAYAKYRAQLDFVTDDAKFLKKYKSNPISEEDAQPILDWLRCNEPVVPCDLPTLNKALSDSQGEIGDSHDNKSTFREEVLAQRRRFKDHLNLSDRQHNTLAGALLQITNMLARHGNGVPAEITWSKVKESGLVYLPLLHNLLYVASTFPTGSARSKAKRRSKYGHLTGLVSILDSLDNDDEPESDTTAGASLVDVVDEIAMYHDLLSEPTEQSINIRVKLLVAQGNAKQAAELLNQHQDKANLRLRGYLPVMRLFLELGDAQSALELYQQMRSISTVHLDADAHVFLLEGLAEHGVFGLDAAPLENATALGFQASCGPRLFDEILDGVSKEIIQIPEAAAKRLRNGLAKGFPSSHLQEVNPLGPLELSEERGEPGELYADKVRIDLTTGKCPKSDLTLRLIQLADDEKDKLFRRLLGLANDTYVKFRETRKKDSRAPIRRKVSAEDHLQMFVDWLDERDGEPFTTIVDGANVGYYQQNFVNGRFNYAQVEFVVNSLKELGENPLVVLPVKYAKDWFFISPGAGGTTTDKVKQYMTGPEFAIRHNMGKEGRLYYVPSGFQDDFYWIMASISSQQRSRGGRSLEVAPDDSKGRWPGSRPVLITNDQMRDHHVEMLEPMLFRRWFSNNIVNYNFAAFADGVKNRRRTIGFCPADFFSREIQGNEDETSSKVWHFPLEGKTDEWFCVRLPQRTSDEEADP